MDKVPESFSLPSGPSPDPRTLAAWLKSLSTGLPDRLRRLAYRTNRTLPEDGSEAMTGPLTLVTGLIAGAGLVNVRVFRSSVTYNKTAGTQRVLVYVQGATGGSGGSAACTAAQVSMGQSTSSGSWAASFLTTGFDGATLTIGAAGTAGAAGGAGGAGGTTSFAGAATISAPGGAGGIVQGPAAPPWAGDAAANAAAATGGNLYNSLGAAAGCNVAPALGAWNVGLPGSSPWAGGNRGRSGATVAGGGALGGSGAGASGAATGPSGAAQVGGIGSTGCIIIYEFG